MIDVFGTGAGQELSEDFVTPAAGEDHALGDDAADTRSDSQRGRPRILDATKRAEVCAMLAAGCTFRTAARYVGVTAGAISMLLTRDELFRAQVDKALADRELIPLAHLRTASGKSWRAAAWLLERTVKGTYRKDNIADPADIGHAVDKELQESVMMRIASEDARTYVRGMIAGRESEGEEFEAGKLQM
jgi:hypothetical protein